MNYSGAQRLPSNGWAAMGPRVLETKKSKKLEEAGAPALTLGINLQAMRAARKASAPFHSEHHGSFQ